MNDKFMKTCSLNLSLLVGLVIGVAASRAAEPTAKGVQDNSFLVEEAYNQEAEMVQHIFNFRRDIFRQATGDERGWMLSFTQEWPVFSQTHQFSYTALYSSLTAAGSTDRGVGDSWLNYRYQAALETDTQPAFSPRLSLLVPTGRESKGLGEGVWGWQVNLPFSKIVQDQWTVHANAGATRLNQVRGRNPLSYNLGGSAVFAATRVFNLMFESTCEWRESVDARGRIEHERVAVFSPGFRYAFNLTAGQLVVGAAVPLALTKAAADRSVFLYFSFEHPLLKK